jgi:hypothetical protein
MILITRQEHEMMVSFPLLINTSFYVVSHLIWTKTISRTRGTPQKKLQN